METLNATVDTIDDNQFINILEGEILIPISEDKPNEVKEAFNKLILRLKKGIFEISIDNVESNLFSQVAVSYLTQLNKELIEIHGELEHYDLISED